MTVKTGPFRLFPEEHRWWSFADYAQLLAIVERFRPRRVLEFGPGGSTLALVEGGAEIVETFEDDVAWLKVQDKRLHPHRAAVILRLYSHSEPLSIYEADGQRYDLAFVDGPRETERRRVEIAYAAERSRVVVTHDATSSPVRDALLALQARGWSVEFIPFVRPGGDENAMGVAVVPGEER